MALKMIALQEHEGGPGAARPVTLRVERPARRNGFTAARSISGPAGLSPSMSPSSPHPGRIAIVAAAATLVIFGALVFGITLHLRGQLREQVLRREAEAMHALALFQIGKAESQLASFAAVDPMQAAFEAVLESSAMRGVVAVQLFDRAGTLQDALPLRSDETVRDRWWEPGLAQPAARFHERGAIEAAMGIAIEPGGEPTFAPLLDVVVPLQTAGASLAAGVARYWIDGGPVAAEFTRMDRALARQAGMAFAGGVLLIGLVLAWAYARLAAANRQLLEQSADLARANQELDFAAKTGALGAISAHLIHGLKNPLAGLEGFVAETAANGGDPGRGQALHTAIETTRRLRGLVNEVVTVLRDEAGGEGDYPVPLNEIVDAAKARVATLAAEAGVDFEAKAEGNTHVKARIANLAGLVLANLITNALEATGPRGRVSLFARPRDGRVEFLVNDSGPGLPPEMAGTLFRPVKSTKRGGGGMGLAISHRLAKHAGGDLELVHSDAAGTSFRLSVPAAPES